MEVPMFFLLLLWNIYLHLNLLCKLEMNDLPKSFRTRFDILLKAHCSPMAEEYKNLKEYDSFEISDVVYFL